MRYVDGLRKSEDFLPKTSLKRQRRRFFNFNLNLLNKLLIIIIVLGLTMTFVRPLTSAFGGWGSQLLNLNGDYLLLFQNNSELRPGGGFIGTYALAQVNNGQIKKIEVDTNVYKKDKAFSAKNCLLPPEFLRPITPCWALRDANTSPDFRESADRTAWFYQQEGGGSVNGLIAIDATFLIELLKLTGDLDLPQYNIKITSKNFLPLMQYEIEERYFDQEQGRKDNEPKTIIKDMMPPLLQKVGQLPKIQLSRFIIKQLKEKHAILYSYNKDYQRLIEKYNFGGAVYQSGVGGDYFYLNGANIGGGKSSLNVRQSVDYRVIEKDGRLVARWRLTRTHTGDGNWPDAPNKEWLRLLVPRGAVLELVTLDGQDKLSDIKQESGWEKTVFSWWSNLLPGKTTVMELIYTLPQTISRDNYSLSIQKQPGRVDDELTVVFDNQLLFQGALRRDLLNITP